MIDRMLGLSAAAALWIVYLAILSAIICVVSIVLAHAWSIACRLV